MRGILDTIPVKLKYVAATNGGEYAGSCPFCGGKDRFRVWPKQGETGRYWCRQCEASGDAIQFLMDYKNISFKEACTYLGIDRGLSPFEKKSPDKLPEIKQAYPTPLWRKRVLEFISACANSLTSDVVEYLRGRGLTDETIRKFKIGYHPRPRKEPGRLWGRDRDVFLPAGIVIPCCERESVIRVKIRAFPDGKPKYLCISGSRQDIPWFIQEGQGKKEAIVVEGEFDGILLAQELGNEVTIIALGGVGCKLTEEIKAVLEQYEKILVALDNDSAGMKAAWHWWLSELENTYMAPPVDGKDITEMVQKGIPVRVWFEGVKLYLSDVGSTEDKEETVRELSNSDSEIVPSRRICPVFKKGDTTPLPDPNESENGANMGQVDCTNRICLTCKHYKPDWNRPLERNGKIISRGICLRDNHGTVEAKTCDGWDPFFDQPKSADPFKVKIVAIRSSGPNEPITWPREDTRAVEKTVNKLSGLNEAMNTIVMHQGKVAWLVSCPALGKNPVWLYHEKDEVLSKSEKATGYVIYSDGSIKGAKFKNNKGDCSHEGS